MQPEKREAIAAHIQTGFAHALRGELIDGDTAIETLRQRRGERLKPAGMSALFQFTPHATEDLDSIRWFIAEDNRDAADRVEMEIMASVSTGLSPWWRRFRWVSAGLGHRNRGAAHARRVNGEGLSPFRRPLYETGAGHRQHLTVRTGLGNNETE